MPKNFFAPYISQLNMSSGFAKLVHTYFQLFGPVNLIFNIQPEYIHDLAAAQVPPKLLYFIF